MDEKVFELDGNGRTGRVEVKEEILKKNNAGLCGSVCVWASINEWKRKEKGTFFVIHEFQRKMWFMWFMSA